MELNRNHYFTLGLLILFLGLQFRVVRSYTLTEESTQFIAQRFKLSEPATPDPMMTLFSVTGTPQAKRQINPPRWLGLSLISLGCVLVLQSLALKKPGG